MIGQATRYFGTVGLRSSALAAFLILLAPPRPAAAGPEGCSGVHGTFAITQNGNVYLIQASDHAVLQCASFNVANWETVQFIQPGAFAKVLNYIPGAVPTTINGTLFSNGIVFFVNPAGVVFGNGAILDVGQIYAAGANLGNLNNASDLATALDKVLDINGSGTVEFTNVTGDVTVQGNGPDDRALISAAAVHLIGQQVSNHGQILLDPGGVVTMSAGSHVMIMGQLGQPVSVVVPLGSPQSVGVYNGPTGEIIAPGGQVILGAGDMYSLAVRHSGVIQAGTVTMQGEDILLESNVASTGDQTYDGAVSIGAPAVTLTASNAGAKVTFEETVDGNAVNAGQESLTVTSAVAIFKGDVGAGGLLGSLDVSGTATVGGNIHATDSIDFHSAVALNGVGDQVIDAGAGTLDVDGNLIKATAGAMTLGGDAGIELAGADTRTINGDLVFDDDVTFNGTGNQSVTAAVLPTGAGTLFIKGAAKPTAGNLTLAGRDGIEVSGNVSTQQGNLVLDDDVDFTGAGNQQAIANGGLLDINGHATKTNTGNLTLQGTEVRLSGNAQTMDGNLVFDSAVRFDGLGAQQAVANGGDLDVNGNATKTTTGSLTLQGTQVRLAGNAQTTAGNLVLNGAVNFDGVGAQQAVANSGDLDVNGNATKTTTGALTLQGTQVRLEGNTQTTTGGLVLTGLVSFDGVGAQQAVANSGDLDVNGNATKTNAGALTLGGNQVRLAGNTQTNAGDLVLSGPVIFDGVGAQQAVANNGDLDVNGNATKITDGALTLQGAEVRLSGNTQTTVGALVLNGPVVFDGAGAQQAVAGGGGALDVNGNATKSMAGSLTLGGTTILLGGDTQTTTGDLTLNGPVTFDGAGAQQAVANSGDLDVNGNATKTNAGALTLGGDQVRLAGNTQTNAGDLVLSGPVIFDGVGAQQAVANNGDLDVNGNATKTTAGALTMQGAEVRLFGNTQTTAGALLLNGPVIFDGGADQQAIANGGVLDFSGDAIKITAGALALQGNLMRAGGDVMTTAGNLTLTGPLIFDGTGDQQAIAAGGVLDVNGSAVKATAGALTLEGTSVLLGGVAETTAGDLILNGPVSFDGIGAQHAIANGGALDVNGNATKTTTGALMLGGASIALAGNTQTTSGHLTLDGPVTFDGIGNQDAIAVGGVLDVNGNAIKAMAGNLTLQGDQVLLAGNTATSDGNLTLTGPVSFDGVGDQQAVATGGVLDVNGNATKTTAGALALGGTAIELAGNTQTTAGDLTLDGPVSFDGTGAQHAIANGGALDVNGNATKTTTGALMLGGASIALAGNTQTTSGHLTLDGPVTFDGIGNQDAIAVGGVLDVNGNAIKAMAGNLTLQGDQVLLAGNTATSDGNLTLTGPVSFDGVGDQQAVATGGVLDVNGNATKTTAGALALGGTAIELAGNTQTTAGNLTLNGPVSFDGTGAQHAIANGGALDVNGNATKTTTGALMLGGTSIALAGNTQTTSGHLTLDGPVTFDGIGNQDAIAVGGVLDVNGNAIKAMAGNLTLQGDQVLLAGNTATSDGNLTLTGPVSFDGVGAQSAVATGGVLDVNGNATKTTAGALMLGGTAIELAGNTQTTAGNLTLNGPVSFDGIGAQHAIANGGALDVNGNATKTTTGALTLGGTSIALAGNTQTTSGQLTLNGPVTFDGAGNQMLVANGGALDVNGNAAKTTAGALLLKGQAGGGADLFLQGHVSTLAGKLTLDGIARFDGAGAQSALAGGNGSLQLKGAVEKVGAGGLTLGGSTISIGGGSVTSAGDQTYKGNLILGAETTLHAGGAINVEGTINGGFGLTIDAGGNAVLQGSIGNKTALARFETKVQGLLIFQGQVVKATGDIVLNEAVMIGVPADATIGATGSLTIVSSAGSFRMGQNQKMTVLGTLNIQAADDAVLSDINTLNDLVVTVQGGDIILLTREAGVTSNGDPDFGLDFVAGGKFFFSETPVGDPNHTARFANPAADGDALGTLQAFIKQALGFQLSESDLANGDRSIFFDRRAEGPTSTDVAVALAGAAPRDSENEKVASSSTTGARAREEMARELGITARPLSETEALLATGGPAVYLDSPASSVDSGAGPHARPEMIPLTVVAVNRLMPAEVERALQANKRINIASRATVQEFLDLAWDDFVAARGAASSPAEFASFLVETGRVEEFGFLSDLLALSGHLMRMGLAEREMVGPRDEYILGCFPESLWDRATRDATRVRDVLRGVLEMEQLGFTAPASAPVADGVSLGVR